jgi:hypothetical protein
VPSGAQLDVEAVYFAYDMGVKLIHIFVTLRELFNYGRLSFSIGCTTEKMLGFTVGILLPDFPLFP